jgi:hypothetical protein
MNQKRERLKMSTVKKSHDKYKWPRDVLTAGERLANMYHKERIQEICDRDGGAYSKLATALGEAADAAWELESMLADLRDCYEKLDYGKKCDVKGAKKRK